MATKVFFINSNQARYTDEEVSAVQTYMLEVGVLNREVGNDDLKVIQDTPASMDVLVEPGGVLISYLKDGITWKVFAISAAQETLTIAANSSGINRVDAIVMALSQDDPNALKNNVAAVEIVLGDGATALSNADIDTALGHTNWSRLADVTVTNGATTIVTADITDTRTPVGVGINTGGYKTRFIGDGSALDGVVHDTVDGDILPDADATWDIGSAVLQFADVYAERFHGDGSDLDNVVSTGSSKDFVLGEAYPANDFPRIVNETQSGGATTSNIYGTEWVCQTFTLPSDMTEMSRVDIKLKASSFSAAYTPLTMAIYAVDGGTLQPTGAALYSTTFSYLEIPAASEDYVVWQFASPLTVTAGGRYAIVISAANGLVGNKVLLNVMTTSGYSGGQVYTSSNSGSTWSSPGTYDAFFRVFGNVSGKLYPFYEEDGVYSDKVYYLHTSTSTDYGTIYAANWFSFTFTPIEYDYITTLYLAFSKTGTPAFGATVAIYATDVNGLPTGAALWSDAGVTISNVNTQVSTATPFSFTVNLAVTEGTKYAIVVSMPGGGTGANYLKVVGQDIKGQWFTATSSNSGSSWTAGAAGAPYGRIHGYKQRTAGKIYRCDPIDPDREIPIGSPTATTPIASAGTMTLRLAGGNVEGVSGSPFTIGQDYFMGIDTPYDTSWSEVSTAYTSYMAMRQTYLVAGVILWAKAIDTATIKLLDTVVGGRFLCAVSDSGQTLSGVTYIPTPKKARYAKVSVLISSQVSTDIHLEKYGRNSVVATISGPVTTTVAWDAANSRISLTNSSGTRGVSTASFYA